MTSSLIFVVLFGVWAAYMLQHWVRRREDLATAQSVDRFSESMHVLERKAPQEAEREAHAPRGAILRPAQPSVAVPYVEESVIEVAPVEERQVMAREGATALSAMAGRLNVKAARGAKPVSPKAKVAALLGAAAFFVVTLVLALFTAVPFWMPVLGLGALGGVFVWLRRSATHREVASPVTRRVVKVDAAPAPAPVVEKVQVVEKPVVIERYEEPVREIVVAPVSTPSSAEAEVFDQGWAPVAVPKPTYTMKAKAEREDVVPAPTVDALPLAARYENASIDELPFDGMALDDDYEELPRVYRAS